MDVPVDNQVVSSTSVSHSPPKEKEPQDSFQKWARNVLSKQQMYEIGKEVGRGAYGIVLYVCLTLALLTVKVRQ